MKDFAPEAILSIRPNSEFSVGETYASLQWYSEDQDKPTEAEFDTALVSVKAEYDAQEYARNRAPLYPAIGDQLDALYHAGVFPEEMAAKLKKVKDDNPKP